MEKVTGTITLPSNASNKEEIKVWGHTEDLNGEIYATELNKIDSLQFIFTENCNISKRHYEELKRRGNLYNHVIPQLAQQGDGDPRGKYLNKWRITIATLWVSGNDVIFSTCSHIE